MKRVRTTANSQHLSNEVRHTTNGSRTSRLTRLAPAAFSLAPLTSLLRAIQRNRIMAKPPGSRSKWSQASMLERIVWMVLIPIRAFICFINVTFFFLAYMGALIPILLLNPVWPRFYWYLEGTLYRGLQAFVGYWGYTAGYDVYEFGDDISEYGQKDRVLVLCNHQSTADVPILFAVLQSKGVATRKTIWLMDVMFRWTPFGMIGRIHGDYFIRQGRATREKELVRLKEHLQKVFWDRDRRWIILFPEGGFFYKRVESSQRYARENGYPHLQYTTLPRMGAAKTILDEIGPRVNSDGDTLQPGSKSVLKNSFKLIKDTVGEIREKKYVKVTRPPVKYVLDVTIAYPNGQPLSVGTLLFGTREECDIAINYRMYDASQVPFRDEQGLQDWMYEVYRRKDKMLENYYNTGQFHDGELGNRIVFSWTSIIGQYLIWISILLVEYKFYFWLAKNVWLFVTGVL